MKNTLLSFCTFLFLCFASQNLLAQEIYTEFLNPSFEGTPRPQRAPDAWWDCSSPGETPIDTHPCNPPAFRVSRPAYDGKTYIGMVVRENNTTEAVSQQLAIPLIVDQCYSFSVYLSVSEKYISAIRGRAGEVNFSTPIFLRIWGGSGFCKKMELLAVSGLVHHNDWREYSFQISPKQTFSYISIETYYHNAFNAPNGHILLDNLSPIYSLDCESLDDSSIPASPLMTPIEYLEKTIMRDGENISFNKKNKLYNSSKEALNSIIEATLTVDDINLFFCIRGRKESKVQARVIELTAALEEIGLDKKRYTVRKYDRTGLDKDNYWFSENKDLFITID